MKKIRVWILGLSLILGITGSCAFSQYFPVKSPAHREQLAWWGGLYPEYCLPGAMELKGNEAGGPEGKEPSVRISFKYLTFLNQD